MGSVLELDELEARLVLINVARGIVLRGVRVLGRLGVSRVRAHDDSHFTSQATQQQHMVLPNHRSRQLTTRIRRTLGVPR